jgi:feruloyl-CoA synthase
MPTPSTAANPAAFFDDPTLLAPRVVDFEDRGNGAFVLRSPHALQPHARCVGEWIEHWAQETPDRAAFAERDAQPDRKPKTWNTLTWRELRARIGAVGQGLLNLQLPAGKPVVVLSDNSLDHLVLMLACLHIGRAVCTVSSAYTRLAQGQFDKIHGILATLDPALVYASQAAVYGPALTHAPIQAQAVFGHGSQAHPGALSFASLQATPETAAVQRAFEAITPDTHAKYLLTSGSTGQPKVVINTQRMLCANQQMLAQTLRFLTHEKPVLLDWLPWSHTFGGNHNIGMVLCHGGTMYIDEGRPVPGAIDATVRNLRDVQPTLHFNVPRGYDMMLPALEADDALARNFFGGLRMLFYAGAAMPQSTWSRLVAACAKVRAQPLWLTTSWGSTETAPANTFAHWHLDRAGVIGLPMPGCEIKFVPNGGKLEMRLRGPHIFPGYRGNEAATRSAFDEEGFYQIGDAGYLADDGDPAQGIVFNGRVAEDFKLTTGTWVSVGTLRVQLIAALAPWVTDAVITGHDRDDLGALLFVTDAARQLDASTLAAHVREGLQALKTHGGGSSQVPRRVLVLPDVPNMAAGEITDKGYVNQRAVLTRRAEDVLYLYSASAASAASTSSRVVLV